MRKSLLLVIAVAVVVSFLAYYPNRVNVLASVGWAGAGGSPYVANVIPQPTDINVSNNTGTSTRAIVQINALGNPCIAWGDTTAGNMDIFYASWNGSSWVNAAGSLFTLANGNVSSNTGGSTNPKLMLDSSDRPCIVWTDSTPGNTEIYFARWNGASWVNASGAVLDALNANISNDANFSQSPDLALDVSNNPCIAWTNWMGTNFDVLYARWNGSGWVNAGGTAWTSANGNVSNDSEQNYQPSLDLDSSGNPWISWYITPPGNYEIILARWNGASWVNTAGALLTVANGNISNNSGISFEPCLKLDSNNRPCVAWYDNTPGNNEIYFARHNGTGWVTAAGAALTATNANISNSSGDANLPRLVLDSNDNPHIAWYDDTMSPGSNDIYYVSWNGANWINVAGLQMTTANSNVSNTTARSYFAALALDAFGNPLIVWDEYAPTASDIYFIKWAVDFEGLFTLAKSVDSNGDGVYDDEGKEAKAGDKLTYKIDWSFDNPSNDPLFDAYVHDVVPEGTTYVAGSATASMLSHSLDNGATWIAGEPPDGAPAGTRLRWKTPQPGWTTANGQILNPTNPNVSNNTGISDFPSLQLDPSTGYPCIAWSDDVSGTTMVYYAKWDGSQWVNAAGLPFTTANGNAGNIPGGDPTLALNPVTGHPWIAFQSNAILFSNLEIHIVKWNGVQWTNAAGAPVTLLNSNVSNNAGLSWYPSHQLALDSNRNPCFVWKDNSAGSWQSYFARWNGANWVNISGAVLNATNGSLGNSIVDPSFWPTLALDSNDNPYIAWDSNITGNSEIYLAKWNGANWVNINGLLLTPTNGNVSNNTGLSLIPYLALDKQTNIPSIVWSDNTPGNYEIYYAKWNGSAWVNSSGATLTATNGNISNNPGNSSLLSMVLDANNLPCVSWEDDTPGNSEIFFARWNGANWTNAIGGNLTASNGLVNSSPGRSWFPSVAVDQLTGNPSIAWLDRTPGNNEVYFAKWTDFGKTFNFSVKISDPFLDYSLSPICNQAEFSHALDSGNHIKSNSVCVSVYKKPTDEKSLLEVTKTAARFAYSSTDIVSFIITVANGGKSDILGVNLVDSYPRELELISSQPQGSKSNGTVRFAIGTLKVGEKRRFELKFKLAKNTVIAEKGIYITNVAKAVSLDSQIESTDQATVLITKDSPLKELVLKVLWAGLNTKTNTAKQGEEISARIMPEGGSSPYEIVIDWGDGQKDRASEITSENYPTFTHTFSSPGEYSVKIICTDQYGKQCVVTRKITVK